MRTALWAKKKYSFINGSVKQPADDSLELEDWWTVNSMLTISHMESVKDLWEDIKQRFSIGNGPRMQQLRSDLANCRQEGQSIVSYFGRLKTLWDEINNYDQIPVCMHASSECNLTIELERKREEERVHQFLMGSDEEGYGTMRSNILSTEPLPNLNRAYAMVVQQERVIQNGGVIDHVELLLDEEVVKSVAMERNVAREELLVPTPHNQLELMNGGNERLTGTQKIFSWIIDIGASHHMTGTLAFFSELRDIVPCSVGLPNGEKTLAVKEGTVLLGGDLKLQRVLYVPDLNCNLDLNSRNLIGAGKQREGLYFLKGVTLVHACKVADVGSFELWHKRMGNPSYKVVELIPEAGSIVRKTNKTCEVCFRAKQMGEIFFSSDNKADGCFELIHCDLWGPYRVPTSCGAIYFLAIVND
ncbi:uncharacterized protein LOC131180171 [Hevea brasiliensis]|uniref:uncharacterized protein LOC131180171 n=1 Tax=Hevea brasiliensis TaxID=3981 RepID=UPI0025DA8285|nr:uncharacterized protein LOC131180171 [Hevea brasiliensis]